MATDTTFDFADGKYRFWLPLPQVFEVERNCGDTSIFIIEERLRAAIGVDDAGEYSFIGGGSAMVKDVREVIRCALIGGGTGIVGGEDTEVGPLRAAQLCDDYVYPARPLSENVVQAWRILHAAIHGIKLEGSKKKTPPRPPATRSTKRSKKVK